MERQHAPRKGRAQHQRPEPARFTVFERADIIGLARVRARDLGHIAHHKVRVALEQTPQHRLQVHLVHKALQLLVVALDLAFHLARNVRKAWRLRLELRLQNACRLLRHLRIVKQFSRKGRKFDRLHRKPPLGMVVGASILVVSGGFCLSPIFLSDFLSGVQRILLIF